MPEITPSKYLITAGWDDIPHLDEATKREMLASTPPHLREARSKGIPSLGAGAIYPIPWDEVSVAPFAIPEFWPRSYALDVGWRVTAAVWGAIDPADGTGYLYAEHYRKEAPPVIHAEGIKARGEWIPGVMDYAARQRSQRDGESLADEYEELGLNLTNANKAVDAGLHLVWTLLASGRLRIFTTLGNLAHEYRLYRRDENGKIVKEHDHLMDCTRMWCMSGRDIAIVKPVNGHTRGASGLRIADPRAGY